MSILTIKRTLIAGSLMVAAGSFAALPALAADIHAGGTSGAAIGTPGVNVGAGVGAGAGSHSGSASSGAKVQGNVAAMPDKDSDSGSADIHNKADMRGNAGGAVRGLNRADEAAGAHGDIGRDRAEQNQKSR